MAPAGRDRLEADPPASFPPHNLQHTSNTHTRPSPCLLRNYAFVTRPRLGTTHLICRRPMAPVAMPSGQTSDLHHVAVAYDPSLLADLGIYSSASALGAAELTIDIDAGRGAKLVARFDSASRRWELLHDAHAAQHVDGQAKPVSPRAKSNGAGVTTPSKRNPLKRSWTDQLMSTDHVNFLKSRDWKATALGPMEEWPISLQLVTHQMLADPRIACIYWFVILLPAAVLVADDIALEL